MRKRKRNSSFKQKCQWLWSAHKKRQQKAKHVRKEVDYTSEELWRAMLAGLREGCEYCSCKLDEKTISVDHADPVSLYADFGWFNLRICCRRCNAIKGMMTETQFKDLKILISTWPEEVRQDLLIRLQRGARGR